jgi:hypothetical protein
MDAASAKQRVGSIKEIVRSFERSRAELLNRRKGSSGAMAEQIDHRLKLNASTIDALMRALVLAEAETKRANQ